MDKDIEDNHKKYLERFNLYKKYGYDVEKEREFIFNKSLPVTGEILEMGTGKGYFSVCLAKHGFKFISVDLSEEEQKFAGLNLRYFNLEKNVDFIIGDAANLNFKDESFDVVFLINVFHHFDKPKHVLDEICRLIRPGGKTVLCDFNEKGFEIVDKIHELEGRKHECLQKRLEDAGDYFAGRGFKVNKCESKLHKIIVVN